MIVPPRAMLVAETVELLVKPEALTVTVKYFLTIVPELSLTLTQMSFVPVPVNVMETEDVVEKSCFVVHVEAEEAL